MDFVRIRVVLSQLQLRIKQSFSIRYPNVVIKSLCGNRDICLNYYADTYFRSRNSVRVLSVTNHYLK